MVRQRREVQEEVEELELDSRVADELAPEEADALDAVEDLAGVADPRALIDRQRTVFLQELRDLNNIAMRGGQDVVVTRLLIEGASLHLQADLKWLDLCEEALQQGEHL